MFERLAQVMGEPQLAAMPEFATSRARVERREEVNGLVARWVGGLPLQEVLARCDTGEVPCGPVYTIADIFRDAQYEARGNLLRVVDERAGPLVLPAAVPRLSETPAEFRHAGRALGADTAEVLGLCDTIATFYRGRMSAIKRHEGWTEEALAREVMHTEAEVL